MASTTAITVLASAARTASGVGSAVDTGSTPHTTVELLLNVTAVSGTATPTLAVTLETSIDGTLGWRAVTPLDAEGNSASFAAVTTVSSERVIFPGCDRYVRARWAITGTDPSFTFSASGLSVLVYATPAQLFAIGVKEESFRGISYADLDHELRAATSRINDTFGLITELPLTTWGDSTTRACCILGAVGALVNRGAEPTAPADDWLMKLYDEIMDPKDGWLALVAAGKLVPEGIVDQTEDEEEGGVVAYSDLPRGW